MVDAPFDMLGASHIIQLYALPTPVFDIDRDFPENLMCNLRG